MQKKAAKRAVSLCKLILVFSLLIFTSRFVDQSHARLFVEFYIRDCDKLTFFSSTHVRIGVQEATPRPALKREKNPTEVQQLEQKHIRQGSHKIQDI